MPKRLLILMGIMAALVAGVLLSYGTSPQSVQGAEEGALLFPALQSELNQISRIEIAQGTVKSTIARDEKGIWRVKEKAGYPANLIMVRGLISAFSRSYLLEQRSAKKENYAGLGLDEARMRTVSLYTSKEEPVATLMVGLQKAARDGTFVRRPDQDQTWLAKYNLAYNVAPEEWVSRELLAIPALAIKSITVTETDAMPVHIYREQEGGGVRLENIPAGKTVKDPVELSGVLAMFDPLTIEDVRPASELLSSSTDGLKLETFDGRTIQLRFNKDGEATWVTLQAEYVPLSTHETESSKAAREMVEKILKHAEGYAFKLPIVIQDKLSIKMNNIVK